VVGLVPTSIICGDNVINMFMHVVMTNIFQYLYLFPVLAVIIVVLSMVVSQLHGYGNEQA
jgi:hypothetical protein